MENADSKLLKQTVDLTGAYDERNRLFEKLRNLRLNDEDRKKAMDEFTAADAEYQKQLSALSKK